MSTGPYFIDKVHDVVWLYLDPPDRTLVFCVDEKSQIEALDRSPPVLSMARRPANGDVRLRPRR